MMNGQEIKRCGWVSDENIYIRYHDEEWGVKETNEYKLFEMLILESFQAGLSWIIILRKRQNFKDAFDNFDYNIISTYNSDKINNLINNQGIIRNKLKILSAISNARNFVKIQNEFGSFYNYLIQFTGKNPIINHFKNLKELPSKTSISDRISKDLKKRGFRFVGSTTIYSFLQATGFMMDHTTDCFRHKQLAEIIKNQINTKA